MGTKYTTAQDLKQKYLTTNLQVLFMNTKLITLFRYTKTLLGINFPDFIVNNHLITIPSHNSLILKTIQFKCIFHCTTIMNLVSMNPT